LQVIDLSTHHYSLLSHDHGVEHDHLLSMVSHTEISHTLTVVRKCFKSQP